MSAGSPRTADRRDTALRWLWIGGGLVVVVAVIVAGVIAQQSTGTPTAQPSAGAGSSSEPAFDLARRIERDPLAMGDVDAPVVIVEYADFRCPFCALFARETLPTIIDEYVDTGLVRIEWRDMPVFGEESIIAAIAGRAAAEQGMFWEYVDAIYADSPERAHPDLPRERLIAYAEQIGIPDIPAFTAALDDPALREAIAADQQEGYSIGVTGTPTFLVNDSPLVGAQPIEAVRATIEQELQEAG